MNEKLPWHSRERVRRPITQAQLNGRTLPACLAIFMGGATAAPVSHETRDWQAEYSATAKSHNGLVNPGTTAVPTMPTPEATPAPVIYEPSSCNMTDHLGNSKVLPHGWHGSGVGNNWCNLCRCNDGAVSCQKR